jgi:hypothetical protein
VFKYHFNAKTFEIKWQITENVDPSFPESMRGQQVAYQVSRIYSVDRIMIGKYGVVFGKRIGNGD